VNEGRRYEVLGVIGRGGFGTVYRADLLGEGAFVRPVALKVLNADMEEVGTVAERLRDEARLLGRIRHRAVVHVDGLVRLDDRWTIVMEYVDGSDLGHLLEHHGKFPVRCAYELAGEVASALHVVHSWPGPDGRPLGILHRDVKPANLLLTPAGEVKVLDFGVARGDFASREAHTQNMRFGSPGYVAPERLEGEERPEGDAYSLGVVLYELLTARTFGKTTVRKERHEGMLEQACTHLPELPDEGTRLLRRMLAWDPDERPAARDIERACRELSPVLSGPYLRDWAEKIVPGALASRKLGELGEDFSSNILTERVSGTVDPPLLRSSTSTLDDFAADLPLPAPSDLPPPPPPLPPPLPPAPPSLQGSAPSLPLPVPPPPRPALAAEARAAAPLEARRPGEVASSRPRGLGALTVMFDLVALSAGVSVLVVVFFGISLAMCTGMTLLAALN
jgi:serine/threonine protein kinase